MSEIEKLVTFSIDVGFRLHKELGPGLLESAYETMLAERLRRSGLQVARLNASPERPAQIAHDGA